jgi:glycosyltransferase involved in cell wall biosynthesis
MGKTQICITEKRYVFSNSLASLSFAYVIEKFPSPTEYFILNEILALHEAGIKIEILVVRKQNRYLNLVDSNKLLTTVTFLPKIFYLFPVFVFFICPRHFISNYHGNSITNNFLKDLRNYCYSLYFARKLKNKSISHIHAHFAFIAVDIARELSGLLKVRHSVTFHAHDIYANVPKIKKVIESTFFVITCTRYNDVFLNTITDKKFKSKIFTVYHGLKISAWTSAQSRKKFVESTIYVLSISRLVEKKGLIYLLKAIHILTTQGHNIQCTIIGEGPMKKQLTSYIKKNELQGAVQLVGFVPQKEIRRHFENSDMFVLPSIIAENGDMDGLPNVILEAMAMGVPVISTPVSAIPEAIEDRITGLLVKEKDEIAMANAILELKNNKMLYKEIATNGRKKIYEKFDMKTSTANLVKIYRNFTQIEKSKALTMV